MEDKIDLEKLTYIASSEEMRSEFLAEIIELRELIETQIGEIAELVNNRMLEKTASRKLGVFWPVNDMIRIAYWDLFLKTMHRFVWFHWLMNEWLKNQ